MKRKFIFVLLFFLSFVLTFNILNVNCVASAEIDKAREIDCESAILYDAKSKTVVFAKEENKRLPIASMTKLMTLSVVFDAIEKGNILLDSKVKISKNSAETEGSEAFLDEKSEYLVSDLIMTVIVCSANDSAVALAEKVSGSENEFVKRMNQKAREMGLKNTNFVNVTGLPAIDHYSSANDVAEIYMSVCENPIYKKYSKIWITELVHPSGRKTQIVNTNRLVKTYEGCDSGKTGYTKEAGYCLSASASRKEMTLVSVVIGAKSSKDRFNFVSNLFDYGFDNFENKTVISKDVPISKVKVSNSKIKECEVFVKDDFVKFLKKGENFEFELKYDLKKIKAPMKAGRRVGKVFVLDKNNIVVFETDLILKDDVQEIKIKEILEKLYENLA